MQPEAGSFAGVGSRRKGGRKGLEAIFTSQTDTRNIEVLTGGAALAAGLVLFILAAVRSDYLQSLGPWGSAVYSSLSFGSLGILLMICGGGTIQFALARHKPIQSTPMATPTNERSESDLSDVRSVDEANRMFGSGSRIGAIAFIQSLLLVVLYAGLVQEFESNSTMRTWVRSNFPVGASLLNWEGVLGITVSLSLLLLQFLPGRYFSEK